MDDLAGIDFVPKECWAINELRYSFPGDVRNSFDLSKREIISWKLMIYKFLFGFGVLIEHFFVLRFFNFEDLYLLVEKLLVVDLFGRDKEVDAVWFAMNFIADS